MKIRFTAMASLALALGLLIYGLRGEASFGQDSTQSRGQLIVELVMYEQDGCEWCDAWNEHVGIVYHKTKEGRLAPLRRLDIHDALKGDLELRTPITYTPTFVLIQKRH